MNYFLHHVVTNQIKIGYSADPINRAQQIMLSECDRKEFVDRYGDERNIADFSSRGRIRLLAYLPGDRKQEKLLHRKFFQFLIGHEWFNPGITSLIVLHILDWVRENAQNHQMVPEPYCGKKTYRQLAFSILKRWIVDGIYSYEAFSDDWGKDVRDSYFRQYTINAPVVRLDGELTWMGRRYEGNKEIDDASGGKFLITDAAILDFCNQLKGECLL